jgi:tRNA A37 threonylcarbamoyladenosine biosynthesis protein TsaE
LSEIKEWLDDERAITFVEWPENLKLSPAVFDVFIRIEIVGQNKRKVSLKWK